MGAGRGGLRITRILGGGICRDWILGKVAEMDVYGPKKCVFYHK